MSMRILRILAVGALAIMIGAGGVSVLRGATYPAPTLPKATQAWNAVADKHLLCIAGDQLLIPETGILKVIEIEKRAPEAWIIRDHGQLKTWKISQRADTLRTEVAGQVTEYRRLDSVPEDCLLEALPVGPAREVPRDRVLAISQDMYDRLLRDQAAIKAGNGYADPANAVIVENREHLKSLIKELGWIDQRRFGGEASGNAIVIAKHSQDLALMMAILPFVEKDLTGQDEANVVRAILYDGLQIRLGRKQRYGTQLGVDSEGHPMVLPMEDASKVEQFRKELGLSPMAEYLKLASEGLYSGKPIRMPRDDE